MNKQHVLVPLMEITPGLLFGDPYVYACIKKYMNKDTKLAYPSIQTIIEITGLNKKTILAAIERLEKNNYFKVIRRTGSPNIYVFNEYTKFEIFSYDFLDTKELSPKAKSYLVIMQHEMRKNPETSSGEVQYNQYQIAEKLGISLPTLRKIERELHEHNILRLIPTNTPELIESPEGELIPITGLKNCIRHYRFRSFFNELALTVMTHEERIDNHDKQLEEQYDRITTLEATVEELKKQLEEEKNKSNKELRL